MVAIQMTRKEYESKYGVAPTPVKMTRAEYNSKYGPTPEESSPNYFQRVGTEFSNIGQDIVSGIKEGIKPFEFKEPTELGRPIRAGLRVVGGITRGAFAPIFQAPGIKQLTEKVVEKATQIPGAHNLIKELTDVAIKYPDAAKDLRDVVDIATFGIGKFAEKPLLGEVKAIGKDIASGAKVILTPSEESIQSKVLTLFQKSIKPTAKKTLSQAERYNTQTINALRTIKANAENLNIEDISGELVSRSPQTINELAQGIDQTKKLVFDQYDNLAKQAGDSGATIDAKPIASEVEKVAQNKALQITNPEIIKYAQNWSERLRNFDVLDTETTQEVIRLMNNNLQTFYKNPTYESASKVAVDAGIANNFRKALDDAIEGATGEQYQILKNQYSALKAIENDVVRASMRDARKNTKGLLDYTDIFTGGQMIGGILSLNPAMFSKGAIERGFKEYIKFLNDPNRAVANIFEKLNIETTKPFEPISATGQFLKNPKVGMSIEDVSKNPLAQEAPKNTKELLVVHNLSEQKLRFADRIGGLSNPSTAVINPKKTAFESYGDISLIGDRNLIEGQKTHLADAYTARFPSVHTSMKTGDFARLEDDLKPYYDQIGTDARKIYHDDTEMLRNIENSPAVSLKFLKENGIKPSKEGQHYYRGQINEAGLDSKFQTFLDEMYKKYNLTERMFAGYTPSGSRRYKPVNLSEASKIMSKQKDEGFNYGLGSYRSKIAPVKTSTSAIKKEAGRLVTKDDFEKIKEAHDKQLWDLKNSLEKYAKVYDSNQFIESDNQLNTIGSILSGEKDAWTYFNSKFPDAPQSIKQDIINFKDKLKKMPTEYFETKFKRPVSLSEFKVAVVPDTISTEALNILNAKGLQIIKYAKGKKGEVMRSLLKHPAAFGIVGAVGLSQMTNE